MLCCITFLHNDTHTREEFLKMSVGLGLRLVFAWLLGLAFCLFFCFSFDHFILMLQRCQVYDKIV